MDHMKAGIGLRGYGQKDPVVEYKREGFQMFEAMMIRIDEEALLNIYRVEPPTAEQESANAEAQARAREDWARRQQQELEMKQKAQQKMFEDAAAAASGQHKPKTVKKDADVGRNDPCPCGSGKKYKKCHGA
jgi:preprotein translocase subunit SecA